MLRIKYLLSFGIGLFASVSLLGQTTINTDVKVNTTWLKSSSPYVISSEIEIWDSATLTIQPGVVVKFKSGKSLSVAGHLVAQGTSGDPIIFTSDNSSKAAGDWGGLRFRGTATSTLYGAQLYLKGSVLKYCTVEYAGYNQNGAVYLTGGATPYIENCTIKHSYSAGIFGENLSDSLVVKNSTVSNNLCSHNGWQKCAIDVGSQSSFYIVGNTVVSNGGGGIRGNYSGYPGSGVVRENTVRSNNGYGVVAQNTQIDLNTITYNKRSSGWEESGGLRYSGWNGVGRISKNVIGWNTGSWSAVISIEGRDSVMNNLIVENSGDRIIVDLGQLNGQQFINNNLRGNTAPTITRMQSSWNNWSNSLVGSNTYDRNTASEQVVLVEAGWSGQTSTVSMQKTNFYYNVSPTIIDNRTNYGDLVDAKNSYWTFRDSNCLYQNNKDYYDSKIVGKTQFSNYTLTADSSLPLAAPMGVKKESASGGVKVTWRRSKQSGFVGYRVYYGSRSNGFFANSRNAGTDTTITISGLSTSDTIAVAAYKVKSLGTSSDFYTGKSSGYAYADASGSIPSIDTACPTFSNPDIVTNTTWYKVNSPYIISSEVEVAATATLTIEAGVVVKFKSGKSLSVAGHLVAQGTSGDPIIFTSDNSSKAAGDWGGLRFRGTATSTLYGAQLYLKGSILKYCTVEYAGYNQNGAVYLTGGATPYIENCTIKHSYSAGIFGENLSDSLVVKNSTVSNNLCSHNGWQKCAIDVGSQSSFYIVGNTVVSNGGGGIRGNYSGYPGSGVVRENTVRSNNGYGVVAQNTQIDLNTITYNKRSSGWEESGGLRYSGWNGVGRISKNVIGWNTGSWSAVISIEGRDSVMNNLIVENSGDRIIVDLGQLNGQQFINNNLRGNTAPTITRMQSSWNNWSNSLVGSNTYDRNTASEQVVLVEAGWSGQTSTVSMQKTNFYYNVSPTIIDNRTNYGDVVDAKNSYWVYTNTDSLDLKIKDYYDSRLYGKVDYSGYKSAANSATPIPAPINVTKQKSSSSVIVSWSASSHPDVTGYRVVYGSRTNGLFSSSVDAGTALTTTISSKAITDTFAVVAYKSGALKSSQDFYLGLSSGYGYADSVATRTRADIDSIKVRHDVRPKSLYISWFSTKSSGVVYNIYRGTSPASLIKVATVGPPVYPYKYVLDTSVIVGTRYYYQIEMVETSQPLFSY